MSIGTSVGKTLAQQAELSINTGTGPSPTWTEIKGLTGITFSPSSGNVDIRDFNSGPWLESLVTNRGGTWSLTGHRLTTPGTSNRDPGQAAVEALQTQVGEAANGHFQYLLPGGETFEFIAHANVTPFGGGLDAVATWNAELTMTGPLTVTGDEGGDDDADDDALPPGDDDDEVPPGDDDGGD